MSQWGLTAVLAVCAAVVVFVLVTVVGGGGSGGTRRATAAHGPFAVYTAREPHVLSASSLYSLSKAPPLPTFPELVPARFEGPVAQYRAYSVAQLGAMQPRLSALRDALAANSRTQAEAAWRAAYATYLHLGAVYLVGPVATLNQEIDGTANGLEGGVSNPHFAGLHRIEYGLWTGAPPRSLVGTVDRLEGAVGRLRAIMPGVSITPLEYATRAHEILEDAQRDLLSGADVPWSGEGPLATFAGLEATKEVIGTLKPLLLGQDGDLGTFRLVRDELAVLRSAMVSIAAEHGGNQPTNGQLTQSQAERLDATLGGALEALSQVPGRLEVETPPHPAPIPSRDVRIDP